MIFFLLLSSLFQLSEIDGDEIIIRKLQKSLRELEKLHNERIGVNLLKPSSILGRSERVYYCLILNFTDFEFFYLIPSLCINWCFLEKVLKSQLFVERLSEKEQYSFIDYISSGFELNFMVAVDFTGNCILEYTIPFEVLALIL